MTNQSQHSFIFFRCELTSEKIVTEAFSPTDYQFTHLYYEHEQTLFDFKEDPDGHAIYILKYALHTTLNQMQRRNKHHFIFIDDVAMSALVNRVKPLLQKARWDDIDSHLGFAVAMDFCPTEATGEIAARTLLNQVTRM